MIKISYLVSTYDSDKYLDGHLRELLERQTDGDFEVIVVNPNSPGRDGDIAKSWVDRDSRVKYIYHPEREPYGRSWIRAWESAKGKYVCNSNTDDHHHPRFTELFYSHMSESPRDVAFCYSGLKVFNEDMILIGGGVKPEFNREVFSRECWAGPQVCWKNDLEFRDELDWDLMKLRSNQHRSAFDYWLWLYFMSLGYKGLSIPYQLTMYMQRSGSIENSNKFANNYETYASISEFFPHNFTTHLKHAKEFGKFDNLPDKNDWIELKRKGKKWKK